MSFLLVEQVLWQYFGRRPKSPFIAKNLSFLCHFSTTQWRIWRRQLLLFPCRRLRRDNR